MAFTSEGMFYLGKEDLAPTIGMVGTGVRGMLGMQNEEEAVKALMASSDLESTEGRSSFLNQLQGISVDAHKEFSKQFQDYDVESLKGKAYAQQVEIQSKSLQMKQEEREANKRVPKLGNWWDLNQKQLATNTWLQTNLDVEHLKGVDLTKMTEARAKALLRKVHKGGASQQIKTMLQELATKRNTYIVNNKFNPEAGATQETAKAEQDVFNLPDRKGTPDAPVQGTIENVATPDESVFVDETGKTYNMGNPYSGSEPTPGIQYTESSPYTPRRGPSKGKELWKETIKGRKSLNRRGR